MTQGEFSKGWKLLILQPWGWRYRGLVEDPRTRQMVPSEESKTQMEFYYSKIKWAQPEAWMEVAELYAQGKEWPSVQDLRQALQGVNAKYIKALPEPNKGFEPPPDNAREIIERLLGRPMSI